MNTFSNIYINFAKDGNKYSLMFQRLRRAVNQHGVEINREFFLGSIDR